MTNKEYAIVALKDILSRALNTVEMRGYCDGYEKAAPGSNLIVADGWDLEFAQMSREEQVEWLIQLFEVLIEHG